MARQPSQPMPDMPGLSQDSGRFAKALVSALSRAVSLYCLAIFSQVSGDIEQRETLALSRLRKSPGQSHFSRCLAVSIGCCLARQPSSLQAGSL